MTSEISECSDQEVLEDSYNSGDAKDELVGILDNLLEPEGNNNSSDDGEELVESIDCELENNNNSSNDQEELDVIGDGALDLENEIRAANMYECTECTKFEM